MVRVKVSVRVRVRLGSELEGGGRDHGGGATADDAAEAQRGRIDDHEARLVRIT